MSTAEAAVDALSGFSHEEIRDFIRNHFEDFVNHQDLGAADRNFASSFVDHGDDVPPNLPAGVEGAKQYLAAAFKRFPDIHVTIETWLPRAIRLSSEIGGRQPILSLDRRLSFAES
jgi:hypothetical protein